MINNFSAIQYWLFDLDNTFYPAQSGVFSQIEKRFTLYIQNTFNLDYNAAYKKQKDYYRQFGTTLNGLMQCDNVDPDEFMRFVHDIDLSMLAVDAEFNDLIANLSGEKYIVTNASTHHAKNILRHMGLSQHVNGIFDIRDAHFIPKPHALYYEKCISKYRIKAPKAAMFDDIADNLHIPHQLGMQTVLITSSPTDKHIEQDIHHTCSTLKKFLLSL